MPAKRQRNGYGHRCAHYGAPYHRPDHRPRYSGDYNYNAGHYGWHYNDGCSIAFIPYGWTWHRAINCP